MTWADRDRAAAVTLTAVVLAVAAVSIRVFGVPPVDLHPPIHNFGIVDPGCGGTRAMYLLLTGHPARAAQYNPVVFPLAAAVALALLRVTVGVLTGRWWEVRLNYRTRRALLVALAIAVLALGVRQQLNAELLMQTWPPMP